MPRADICRSNCRTPRRCVRQSARRQGCGEAGAIGASAAVINAITDAIGSNKLEMPATPDRVWHAIHG
jgi:carbon-monoxide dehydrogenase large subunit